jgi:hypothetical protein
LYEKKKKKRSDYQGPGKKEGERRERRKERKAVSLDGGSYTYLLDSLPFIADLPLSATEQLQCRA